MTPQRNHLPAVAASTVTISGGGGASDQRSRPLLARLFPERRLAIDSSILFGGLTLHLVTQVGWLLLALLFLGPDGYGTFVGLTAVTVITSYLAGPGCEQLIVRRAAGQATPFPQAFGEGLFAIFLTGVPLAALLLWPLPMTGLAPIGSLPLLAIVSADLLLGRVGSLCAAAYVATGAAARQSLVTVAMGLARLSAIALAGLVHPDLSLAVWALWYLAAAFCGALFCLLLVMRDHGAPRLPTAIGDWRARMAFASEAALQAAAADIDKPIVLALAGPVAAGYYAAASRIIGTLLLPMRAIGYALYGKLFRLGEGDRAESARCALGVLPFSAAVNLLAALGVLACADLVPMVLGPAYDGLPALLRLFCLLPLAMAVFTLGADVLSATRFQGVRLAVVAASFLLTAALCWWAVPLVGVEGAALVRVGVTALGACVVWAFIQRRLRGPKKGLTP